MTKKLTRYQKTQNKLQSSEQLFFKDVSGKTAHQFRAALVGNPLDKPDMSGTKTHVFGIDIPSDVLQDSSVFNLDKMARFDFALNGVEPGSITNAILNLQLRGYALYSSAGSARTASAMAGTESQYLEGASVAKVYPLISSKIQSDATVAGALVLSHRECLNKLKDDVAAEDEFFKNVSVVDRNALSWLLNTSGRKFLSCIPEGDPIVFEEIAFAHEYRSRIEGKIKSWETNYKNSLASLYSILLKTSAQLNARDAAVVNLLKENSSSFHTLKQVLLRYFELCHKAVGRATTGLTEEEAIEFLIFHEKVFEPAMQEYHRTIRSAIDCNKKLLKLQGLSGREVTKQIERLKADYTIQKLPRIKKLGGPAKVPGIKIQEKLDELNLKTSTFFSLVEEVPSLEDIYKLVNGRTWSTYADTPNDRINSDEGRFRRNLDDLVRVAFGNSDMATRVYSLLEPLLGGTAQNKLSFMRGFLFGVQSTYNKKINKYQDVRRLRVLGKLAYSHTEQDIEPYAYFLGNSFETELQSIDRLTKLANACKRKINQQDTGAQSSKLNNAAFLAYFSMTMRAASWKLSIAQAYNTDLSMVNSFNQARINLGRLFVDIQNLLENLNPPSGELAYTFVYNSPIEEASNSIRISPFEIDSSIKTPEWIFNKGIAPGFFEKLENKNLSGAEIRVNLFKQYSKIRKDILYTAPDGPKKPTVEDSASLAKYEKSLRAYKNKLDRVATEDQREILDAMWKIPHELSIGLPSCLQHGLNKEYRFRLKGVSSQKTDLAKDVARKQGLSDGSFVFNVRVKAGLYFDVLTKTFKPVEDYKGKIVSATYNLPTSYAVPLLDNTVRDTFQRMLAVDLNANGIGVSLFDKVALDNEKSTFVRIPVKTREEQGVLKHFICMDGRESSFQVFYEIPELELLKDKVSFYRKNQQKTRKFGAFLDPQMEQYKKMVIGRIRKTIEQLMFRYKVGYLAFENEVSNLETGAAQLRTVYKSIVNFYLWPENSARIAQKKAYWLGASSTTLTGAQGNILKFHPGQGVSAAGTSQTCSTCGQNPIKRMYDERFGVYPVNTPSGSVMYQIKAENGDCFLEIPGTEALSKLMSTAAGTQDRGTSFEYAKLLNTILAESDKKKVISSFKTKFMRTDLNSEVTSGQTRSKQSRYVCYNPKCSEHGKARDADHNAANNIGQRLIDKLSKPKSCSEEFWNAIEKWLHPNQVQKVCEAFSGKVKKDGSSLAAKFYISSNEVKFKEDTSEELFDAIVWALSKEGINVNDPSKGEFIKVNRLNPKNKG